MLAAQKESNTESKKTENDVFSNIFAGLSFPDAPTNTNIKKSAPSEAAPSPFIQEEDMIELQSTTNINSHQTRDDDHVPYIEELEDFPILPVAPSTSTTLPSPAYTQLSNSSTLSTPSTLPGISISAVQQSQATLTAQQFESLYGHIEEQPEVSSPKDSSGSSMYPSLGALLSASTSSPTSSSNISNLIDIPESSGGTQYSHNPAYYEEQEQIHEQEQSTEQTPFLQQEQVASVPHESQAQQQAIQLRQENERLQRELLALQNSMSNTTTTRDSRQTELSSPVVISSSVTGSAPTQQSLLQPQTQTQTPSPLNVAQIQQRQLQIQQQLQENQMRTQAQPQTATQMGTGSRTGHEQASLKYVCCGSCRQWLSSPRDASLVYCPGCGAVNNCDINSAAGPASTPAPTTTSSRPPARRVGEGSPWYLQCVEKLF